MFVTRKLYGDYHQVFQGALRKRLNLPHLDLAYLEWGEGPETVLLLHGLADHAGVWADLAECLTPRYHCIAPDLRGHGDSSKPAQGYRCVDLITDLEALMDHAKWTSAHVICHSWSAKVAAIWARQFPHRVRSLVLVDPFFINQMPGWMRCTFPILYRVLPFLKTMGPFPTYQQAEQQARSLKQYRGWSDRQQRIFQQSMEQKPDGSWGSKFTVQARNGIFDEVQRAAGLTQPLHCPALFVKPEKGLNRIEWQLKPYRTYLPHLHIQTVPGHHWCFLVEPDAVNQAIASFLDRQHP